MEEFILRDNTKVFIRNARPSDATKIIDFLNQLDSESIYMRFGHFTRYFDKFAQELTCNENVICLLACDEHGKVIGLADAHRSNDEAEVGVVVHQSWRNKGLGKILIKKLIEETQKRGIKWLYAYVLRENIPVFNLLRKFNAKPVASEGNMVKVKGPAFIE